MKKFYMLLLLVFLGLSSCGPVIVSHRIGNPPPPWFYPNRIELVRYIYFPDIRIYYDLTARTYIYLDGGIWVRRNTLPARYRNYDLRRSRYERIRNYHDDDIKRYDEQNNANRGRSNLDNRRRSN